MTLLESLPPRPLSDDEVTSLDTSGRIVQCLSLAGLRTGEETVPPTDMVIGLYIETDTATHVLVYDAGDNAWLRVDTLEPNTPDISVDSAVDHIFNWLGKHYESKSLAFI